MQCLQESSQIHGGEGSNPVNPFSFLNFTPTNTTANATTVTSPPDEPSIHCTTYLSRNNSIKKRRRRSSVLPRLTRHKKTYPDRRQQQQQEGEERPIHHQPGFAKMDMPIIFPSPVLRRSFSDPYNNPGIMTPAAAASPVDLLNSSSSPHSPVSNASPVNLLGACVNASNNISTASAAGATNATPSPIKGPSSPFASLPPRPRSATPLFRSVSDPSNVTSIVPASAAKDTSPNSKRLKRMKSSMAEMTQWLHDIITEGQEDDDSSHEPTATIPKQATLDSGSQEPEHGDKCEEEVSVERLGDYLSVNIKCPCGKSGQILLKGNHCYYKLL